LLASGIPIAAVGGYVLSTVLGTATPSGLTVRATIEPPSSHQLFNDFGGYLALSPDGTQLVFGATDSTGTTRLWLRPLASAEARPLSGTEGASYPFWSPDGREIAFFSNTKLRKIDLLGSPPLDIANVAQGRGGAWSPNGTIVVSPIIGETNLFTVPSGGGELTKLTSFDSTAKYYPRFPSFLPDGQHFLYVGYAGGGAIAATTTAFIGSLDGTVQELPIHGSSHLIYSAGHLVYLRENTLIAQAFDPSSLKLTGDPIPLDKGLTTYSARAKGNFTGSPNDVIAYVRDAQGGESHIVWIDRNGRTSEIAVGKPTLGGALSPDGTKFVYNERDDQGNDDVWIYDIPRHIRSRFTFSPDPEVFPLWTPDSKDILYNSVHGSDWKVVAKSADGTAGERTLFEAKDTELQLSAISPDGHTIAFSRQTLSSGFDIVAGDIGRPGVIDTILSTRFHEYLATFSPDGKWIAYQSDASGRYEIYVRRFAKESEKWQISTSGGTFPTWMRNGEVAFVSNNKAMAARVSFAGGVPHISVPTELFALSGTSDLNVYDASADGKRFIGRAEKVANANAITLIANWHRLAEKK
jgi:Tol biopolymer transport system component